MKRSVIACAVSLFSLSCAATTYQCSLYEVEVQPLRYIKADGEVAQYGHSTLDKNMNLINTYQNKERSMLIRETPKGRIAFRVVGDFGWKSCEVIEDEKQ
ncbi:MAG: hypothetical protein [Caudoviricetes sp.]|nr:MAG: hypothetical protein [Caudoviricetes sp.]